MTRRQRSKKKKEKEKIEEKIEETEEDQLFNGNDILNILDAMSQRNFDITKYINGLRSEEKYSVLKLINRHNANRYGIVVCKILNTLDLESIKNVLDNMLIHFHYYWAGAPLFFLEYCIFNNDTELLPKLLQLYDCSIDLISLTEEYFPKIVSGQISLKTTEILLKNDVIEKKYLIMLLMDACETKNAPLFKLVYKYLDPADISRSEVSEYCNKCINKYIRTHALMLSKVKNSTLKDVSVDVLRKITSEFL